MRSLITPDRLLFAAQMPAAQPVRRMDRLIAWLDPPAEFNFRHFRPRHMAAELLRSSCTDGVPPGTEAPDFDLETTEGGRLRLSSLRGKPVLLHFGSYTCPLTRGGVLPMRELHHLYGDRIQFVDVIVRQAHPGERHGTYRTYAAKMEDARRYKAEEQVRWPVAVDDLEAGVQLAYGGLSASIYLLDAAGRVVFCGMWGQSYHLRRAIDRLLENAPPVRRIDRLPRLGAAIVAGRHGPASGGRMALVDLEIGFPLANPLMAVGHLCRPLVGPLVLTTEPPPAPVRIANRAAGPAAVGLLAARLWSSRRHPVRSGCRFGGRRARRATRWSPLDRLKALGNTAGRG